MGMQVGHLAPCITASPSIVNNTKRDTVLTTLLLIGIDDLKDLKLYRQCLDSIQQGSAHIDEELVFALYKAGDPKAQLAIARSVATSRMSPPAFRRIFDPVYARSDLSARQRCDLASNLHGFLRLNPGQGRAYERIALTLARSPHFDSRVQGIQIAAEFARVDSDFLDLVKHRLKSRHPITRLAAVAALHLMVNRLDQLAPEIREFITSDALRDMAARMRRSDPDYYVRWSSRDLHRKLLKRLGRRKRRASRSRRR